jgi:hypothetical protein
LRTVAADRAQPRLEVDVSASTSADAERAA